MPLKILQSHKETPLYLQELGLTKGSSNCNKKLKSNRNLNPLFLNMNIRVLTEFVQGGWKNKEQQQLQEVKPEPEKYYSDEPVKKTIDKKQSKVEKGERVPDYKRRPKTRATNKLRLNSKSLFKPSLKKDNLIVLDDDDDEKITQKTKKQLQVPETV
jgi:hypothetical protein